MAAESAELAEREKQERLRILKEYNKDLPDALNKSNASAKTIELVHKMVEEIAKAEKIAKAPRKISRTFAEDLAFFFYLHTKELKKPLEEHLETISPSVAIIAKSGRNPKFLLDFIHHLDKGALEKKHFKKFMDEVHKAADESGEAASKLAETIHCSIKYGGLKGEQIEEIAPKLNKPLLELVRGGCDPLYFTLPINILLVRELISSPAHVTEAADKLSDTYKKVKEAGHSYFDLCAAISGHIYSIKDFEQFKTLLAHAKRTINYYLSPLDVIEHAFEANKMIGDIEKTFELQKKFINSLLNEFPESTKPPERITDKLDLRERLLSLLKAKFQKFVESQQPPQKMAA